MAQSEQTVREVNGVSIPPPGVYELDLAHTRAEFVARHMLSKVRGRFAKLSGSVTIAERPEDSHTEIQIDTASVQTDEAKRDGHLRSGDFFETETYPTITFKSTGVRLTGGTRFELDGELTVKDVTKPITLTGEFLGWGKDMSGDDRLFAEAKTRINREDWGLTWNVAVEIGGVLVGKDVDLEIEVEATKPAEA